MTDTTTPTASIAMVSIDCEDAAVMGKFYNAVLGWPLVYEGDGYAMLQQGDQRVGFGSTPDYRRPSWPDDGHKQFHLDLSAEDVEGAVARCVALGASKPDEHHRDIRQLGLEILLRSHNHHQHRWSIRCSLDQAGS